ncbi:MAG: asparagine synthase C-terminal domain-containing protein [Candidatus Methanomethylophilaceae archaeon]|jgi:asparagine synthase (glutamine-hydrolysing)
MEILSDAYARYVSESLNSAAGELLSGEKTAVAFSGGLDSGIVAALCKRYAESTVLYTVGTEKSYDVLRSASAAEALGLKHKYIGIGTENIESVLKEMIRATGTEDPLILSFEVPTFCVMKHSAEKTVAGGMGADELFAGYMKYVGLSENEYREMLSEDLPRLEKALEFERKAAEHFGKKAVAPFSHGTVRKTVSRIPYEYLSSSGPAERKTLLKKAASHLGCGFLASAEKKAAQYGSGVSGLIKAKAKEKGLTLPEYVSSLAED